MSVVTKACSSCGESFEFEAVGRFAEQLARLRTHCPPCDAARSEQWAADDAAQAARAMANTHRSRLLGSGLPECFWADGIPRDTPDDAADAVRRFANGETRGVILTGTIGNGKTTLIGRAFYRRLYSCSGYWGSVPHLMRNLRADMKSRRHEEAVAALTGSGMLALDDLDKVKITEYVGEQLYLAIDNAYSRRAPLAVTANRSLREISEQFADPATGEAIADRLREHCVWVEMTGPSRRRAAE